MLKIQNYQRNDDVSQGREKKYLLQELKIFYLIYDPRIQIYTMNDF